MKSNPCVWRIFARVFLQKKFSTKKVFHKNVDRWLCKSSPDKRLAYLQFDIVTHRKIQNYTFCPLAQQLHSKNQIYRLDINLGGSLTHSPSQSAPTILVYQVGLIFFRVWNFKKGSKYSRSSLTSSLFE